MKITDIVDKLIANKEKTEEKPVAPYLKRGTRGRFVSKKKAAIAPVVEQVVEPVVESAPDIAPHETITASFYGVSITKYRIENKWYFSVSDVLTVAQPFIGQDKIEYTDEFEEVKKKNSIIVNKTEVAEAQKMLLIIKEVKGVFPGPLSRWLTS